MSAWGGFRARCRELYVRRQEEALEREATRVRRAFAAVGGAAPEKSALPEGVLRKALALWGAAAVPFFRPFRK